MFGFDSPILDEALEILRHQVIEEVKVETGREVILIALDARFGTVPAGVRSKVVEITDPDRLGSLIPLAANCPDIAAFAANL